MIDHLNIESTILLKDTVEGIEQMERNETLANGKVNFNLPCLDFLITFY